MGIRIISQRSENPLTMRHEQYIPHSALVACSRLVEFAGAEIATLEIAEALHDLGVEVELAALEIGPPIEAEIASLGIKYIDLGTTPIGEREYDLAWVSHNVVAYHLFLRDRLKVKTGIYSSHSYFEPIETPPSLSLKFSHYAVNSEENLSHFISSYPELSDRVSVFPNSCPERFLNAYRSHFDNKLRSLAVVSNHPPEEIMELTNVLRSDGVTVDLIGVHGRKLRITPDVLSQYSAILTIGKTVQYGLAIGTPVFCYDRFGGPGWITLQNIDSARAKNFSGRCTPVRRQTDKIVADLSAGFSLAASQREQLRAIALMNFDLKRNLLHVLNVASKSDFVRERSETNAQILSRESSLYLNLRHIIKNCQQALSEQSQQISGLRSEVSVLKPALAERDAALAEVDAALAERNAMIKKLLNSTSWRMTAPARAVGVFVRQFARHLNDRIAWIRYLYRRSFMVIRDEGWRRFARKACLRASGWARYRVDALKHKSPVRSFATYVERNNSKRRCLVSFVIPIYDRTDVLRAAISSALNQTMRDLEVILVTDGSPPETLSVVNEFIDNARVRIFHFPISSGNAVRARNKGILEARGKYVAFLDSDDFAMPDRLERSLEVLESGKADVVYGAWRAVLDGTRDIDGISNGQIVFSPDCDLEMLRAGCVPCQSTVIVRREVFFQAGFLKPVMEYREDHELWLRLAATGAKFRSIPHVLADLRLHAGNNELKFKDTDSRWRSLALEELKTPGPIPKKIAFILPGVGISGGVGVVLKHADLLISKGHDAFVINLGEPGTGAWFSGHRVPVVHVSDKRRYLFENIDMLFATGWNTTEWLDRFEAKRKLYFVQSDERRFFDDPALKRKIGNSYRMNCEFLTEARWIRTMLKKEFSKDAYYVPNGLDTSVFYPDTPLIPKDPARPRVLLEGPITIPFKGMDDAYAAVEPLNCEIWIVSSAGKPKPNWRCDRFFEAVSFDKMRKIYSSCDIFLKMSRVEGFFGPPLESMACGCAVVVSKVTGWDEYIVENENALVVDHADIRSARSAVNQLINDKALRDRLIQNGCATVKNWSWRSSLDAMLAVVEGPPTTVHELDAKRDGVPAC